MQIDGLVCEGRRSVSGMTGLCPSCTKPPGVGGKLRAGEV